MTDTRAGKNFRLRTRPGRVHWRDDPLTPPQADIERFTALMQTEWQRGLTPVEEARRREPERQTMMKQGHTAGMPGESSFDLTWGTLVLKHFAGSI